MNTKNNRKKGMVCIGLGLTLFLILCMDIVVLCVELVFCQNALINGLTAWQHCLHFIIICIIWGCGCYAVYRAAKEKALLPDTGNTPEQLGALHIFPLCLIVAAGILFMSLDTSGFSLRLKPLSELTHFLQIYGNAGIAAFFLQHLYYLFESVLILFLIVLGQQAGEYLFPFHRSPTVLWGGIFCAMTWGMLHGLTKDWETAVFCIVLSVVFNLSYFAANRRLLPSYLAIALIFVI